MKGKTGFGVLNLSGKLLVSLWSTKHEYVFDTYYLNVNNISKIQFVEECDDYIILHLVLRSGEEIDIHEVNFDIFADKFNEAKKQKNE